MPLTPRGSNPRLLLRRNNALEYFSKEACQGEGRFSVKSNSYVFYVLGSAFVFGSEQDNVPVGLIVGWVGAEEAAGGRATAESCEYVPEVLWKLLLYTKDLSIILG